MKKMNYLFLLKDLNNTNDLLVCSPIHLPLHSVQAVHSDKTQSGGHDLKHSSTSDVSNNFDTDKESEIVDNKFADSKCVDKHFSADSFKLSFPAPDRSQVTFRRATPMPHSAPCNGKFFLNFKFVLIRIMKG
jgi:hypothetical protein